MRFQTSTTTIISAPRNQIYDYLRSIENYSEYAQYYANVPKVTQIKKNVFFKELSINIDPFHTYQLKSLQAFYPQTYSFRAHMLEGIIKELHWSLKIAPQEELEFCQVSSAHSGEIYPYQDFHYFFQKIKNIEESFLVGLKNKLECHYG